jgi:copper oxidase (laccase) domain-containing protein
MVATSDRMVDIGEAALNGWRGTAGRAIAKPVAKHTGFRQEQVEAAIGFALLAYATYRLARPLIAAMRREH